MENKQENNEHQEEKTEEVKEIEESNKSGRKGTSSTKALLAFLLCGTMLIILSVYVLAKTVEETNEQMEKVQKRWEESAEIATDYSTEKEVQLIIEDKSFGQVGVPQWTAYYFTVIFNGEETYLRVPKGVHRKYKTGDIVTVYQDKNYSNSFITKEGYILKELAD